MLFSIKRSKTKEKKTKRNNEKKHEKKHETKGGSIKMRSRASVSISPSLLVSGTFILAMLASAGFLRCMIRRMEKDSFVVIGACSIALALSIFSVRCPLLTSI